MQKKLIITALGAFGLGGLVGWAITADIYENRFKRERADYDEMLHEKREHIWALQDRCERLANPPKDEAVTGSAVLSMAVEADPNQTTINDVPIEEAEEDDGYVVPEGETPAETRSNLQRLIDTYAANPEAQTQFVEAATIDSENSPPFVISRANYAYDEEGDNYSKITITYFPRERVLLDDDDEPINDVIRTVGWRNLAQFGGESEDPDVVFIRNRRMQTDFEVIKDDDAQLPLHVKYGMGKEEFLANKAAGLIKFRQEDNDH